MKRKNFRQDGHGEETTRRAAQRKKGGAKVRTARQKVCRLLCEALGAVRVRTGVGTPVPLRLLAQTFARSRGVIFEGLPRSELWEALYNSICLIQGREITPPGDPTAALKSGQNFTRRDARCHGTAKPFSAQTAQAPRIGSGRHSNFSRRKSYEKKKLPTRRTWRGDDTTSGAAKKGRG